MKKSITLLLIAALSASVNAKNDFEIASDFMAKKGITLVDNQTKTRRASGAYSVFSGKDGNGFAVVCDGRVVGYSTETTLNEENMPCGLEEMLGLYSEARTRSYEWFTPRDIEPIAPMITTKWNQTFPYNEMTPEKYNICVTIAYAQLLHYFKIPHTYSEFELDYYAWGYEYFPIMEFDHDKMLDEYIEGEYTQEEVDEVARFCKCINWGFANQVNTLEIFNLEQFIMQEWEYESKYKYVDESLENGIPLWWSGNCHAYIIDGRDSEGRYHVNFGWGGIGDGYYEIPDSNNLNPSASGYDNYVVHPSVFNQLIPKGWTSSIGGVKRSSIDNTSVYNLQGQKVGNSLDGLAKGIYIKEGKKHVVK